MNRKVFAKTHCLHKCVLPAAAALVLAMCACESPQVSGEKQARARENEVRSMTDQVRLAAIAVEPKESVAVQAMAISKLTNQQFLVEIAESPTAINKSRMCAVRAINNQAVLVRIATNDKYPPVRREAILRLTDEQTLANIAIKDSGMIFVPTQGGSGRRFRPLACDAADRLKDQALLARVAIECPRKDTIEIVQTRLPSAPLESGGEEAYANAMDYRPPGAPPAPSGLGGYIDAIRDSSDTSTITTPDGRTLSNPPQYKPRRYTPRYSTEKHVLSSFDVNQKAISKLTDPNLLAKVKAESKEPSVQAAAGRRLAELPTPPENKQSK